MTGSSGRGGRRGAALPLFLACFVFVLALGVMALEAGNYALAKVEIQKACDQAAVVGMDLHLRGYPRDTVVAEVDRTVRLNLRANRFDPTTVEGSVSTEGLPEEVAVTAIYRRRTWLPVRALGVGPFFRVRGRARLRVPGMALAYVLDISGSMKELAADGRQRMANLRDVTRALLARSNGSHDRTAVVTYSSRPRVERAMGSVRTPADLERLRAEVSGWMPEGGTGLASALEVGRDELDGPAVPPGLAKYAFVVTDGDPGSSSPLRITGASLASTVSPNVTPRVARVGAPFPVYDYHLGGWGNGQCGEGVRPGIEVPDCRPDVNRPPHYAFGGLRLVGAADSLTDWSDKGPARCNDLEMSPLDRSTPVPYEGALFMCEGLIEPTEIRDNCYCGQRTRGCQTGAPEPGDFTDGCPVPYVPPPPASPAAGSCCVPDTFSVVSPDGYATPPVTLTRANWMRFHYLNAVMEADYTRKTGSRVFAFYAGPRYVSYRKDPTYPANRLTVDPFGDIGVTYRRFTLDPEGAGEVPFPGIPDYPAQLVHGKPGRFFETESDTSVDYFWKVSREFMRLRFSRVE